MYSGGPAGKDRWKRKIGLDANAMAKDDMERFRRVVRQAYPSAFGSLFDWGEHICAAAWDRL